MKPTYFLPFTTLRLAAAGLALSAFTTVAQPYDISWFKIAGGGGMQSTGGVYSLRWKLFSYRRILVALRRANPGCAGAEHHAHQHEHRTSLLAFAFYGMEPADDHKHFPSKLGHASGNPLR